MIKKAIKDIIQKASSLSMSQKSVDTDEKERTEKLETKVWNELYDAKKNETYLCRYLGFLRAKRKKINIGIIICALVGLILERWVNNASFVTLSLFVLLQLFKEIIPILSVDEKLLDKLPEYRMLYVQKFELLNKLYFDMECKNIDVKAAQNEYFRIREMNLRIEDLDNSIHLPEKKDLFAIAETDTAIYMSNFFGLQLTEQEDEKE